MPYRRELRTACHGKVHLFLEGSTAPVTGLLKDVSNRGFRASHDRIELIHGMEVGFVHEFSRGQARVIWSRIADGAVESGFLLLPG